MAATAHPPPQVLNSEEQVSTKVPDVDLVSAPVIPMKSPLRGLRSRPASISIPSVRDIRCPRFRSRRLSDSKVPRIIKDNEGGTQDLEQLKHLHAAREQLVAEQSSPAAKKRPTTWKNTLEDVNDCIGTILEVSANAHLEASDVETSRSDFESPGRPNARKYMTDIDAHDEVDYRISRHLREPITVSEEATSQQGIPLRIEAVLDAYSRGEFSTGQPEEEHLPLRLRSFSSPNGMGYCGPRQIDEEERETEDSQAYFTAESGGDQVPDSDQTHYFPTLRRTLTSNYLPPMRSIVEPSFALHNGFTAQTHIHPALRSSPSQRFNSPDDKRFKFLDNDEDDDEDNASFSTTPQTAALQKRNSARRSDSFTRLIDNFPLPPTSLPRTSTHTLPPSNPPPTFTPPLPLRKTRCPPTPSTPTTPPSSSTPSPSPSPSDSETEFTHIPPFIPCRPTPIRHTSRSAVTIKSIPLPIKPVSALRHQPLTIHPSLPTSPSASLHHHLVSPITSSSSPLTTSFPFPPSSPLTPFSPALPICPTLPSSPPAVTAPTTSSAVPAAPFPNTPIPTTPHPTPPISTRPESTTYTRPDSVSSSQHASHQTELLDALLGVRKGAMTILGQKEEEERLLAAELRREKCRDLQLLDQGLSSSSGRAKNAGGGVGGGRGMRFNRGGQARGRGKGRSKGESGKGRARTRSLGQTLRPEGLGSEEMEGGEGGLVSRFSSETRRTRESFGVQTGGGEWGVEGEDGLGIRRGGSFRMVGMGSDGGREGGGRVGNGGTGGEGGGGVGGKVGKVGRVLGGLRWFVWL